MQRNKRPVSSGGNVRETVSIEGRTKLQAIKLSRRRTKKGKIVCLAMHLSDGEETKTRKLKGREIKMGNGTAATEKWKMKFKVYKDP